MIGKGRSMPKQFFLPPDARARAEMLDAQTEASRASEAEDVQQEEAEQQQQQQQPSKAQLKRPRKRAEPVVVDD